MDCCKRNPVVHSNNVGYIIVAIDWLSEVINVMQSFERYPD